MLRSTAGFLKNWSRIHFNAGENTNNGYKEVHETMAAKLSLIMNLYHRDAQSKRLFFDSVKYLMYHNVKKIRRYMSQGKYCLNWMQL